MIGLFVTSLGLLGLVLLGQFIIAKIRFNRTYKFPNLLPGWPLVGSLFDVPYPAGMWGVSMTKKYGDMFSQKIGARYLVYLNSSEVVSDLMEKRATINSRPHRPNLNGIMSNGARTVYMQYDDEWRKQRKLIHGLLNTSVADKKFAFFQDFESKQLVYDTLKDSHDFARAAQRFSNSVILGVVFGRRARTKDELLMFIINYTGVLGLYQHSPLRNLPDFLPLLWYLPKPLQWWRIYGNAFNNAHIKMFQKEIDIVEKKVADGTSKDCFAAEYLFGPARKELTPVQRLYTLSDIVEAGSDTSRTAILQMMAGAACYPDWAAKARALMDDVCGHNAERLPVLADKPKLPYLTAVMKETLRWRPFLQAGVPHTSTEDIEYRGYKFPAGTDFTFNGYSISLNEKDYADPERFWPDRFMNEDLDKLQKGHWSFGAGRRICGGYHVGAHNVWIASAVLLYCFDFAEDPDHPIDQFNTQWEVPVGRPFPIKITPRSQAHIDLIERGMAEVRAHDY